MSSQIFLIWLCWSKKMYFCPKTFYFSFVTHKIFFTDEKKSSEMFSFFVHRKKNGSPPKFVLLHTSIIVHWTNQAKTIWC